MVTVLARNLRLSATPVREALSRLAGEGLIEDRRGTGFFAWRLDAVDLVELYDLQATYLTTALESAARSQFMSLANANDTLEVAAFSREGELPIIRVEAVFEILIADARSAALARAHGLLADRLAPSRHAESTVLSDAAGELATLERAVVMSDRPAILHTLSNYHRRRTLQAPQIVAAMRASAVSECMQSKSEAAA